MSVFKIYCSMNHLNKLLVKRQFTSKIRMNFCRYFPFKTTDPITLKDTSQLANYLLCPKLEKAQATRLIY